MKNSSRKLTAGCLSGLLIVSMAMPAFSQNYTDSYANDYSYSQPAQQAPAYQQTPAYQQAPAYQQPVQNQYQAPMQPAQNYSQTPQVPGYNTIPAQNNYSLPPLQGHVVSVPPGTMLPGVTTNRPLSSQNLRTGDRISVLMNTPFYYAGTIALPAGTSIMGTVVMAESAGRAGKHGKLMIVFNQAVTPQGQNIGFSGKLATDDGTGILKGGTGMSRTKEVVKDTAVGAGAGALLGGIFGAISGGRFGKGAAMGTAIGGGTGIAKTLIDKGKNVVINAGEQLNIILDSELRIGGEQSLPQKTLPSVTPDYNYNY